MNPLVFGSSNTARISAAASLARRRAAARHHRKLVATRSWRHINPSPRVKRSDPVASKKYNPHNPAAQISPRLRSIRLQ
jgi:hypothetical protein